MNNSFENSLKELENIVNILEKGECTLDESVKLFEKGVNLAKQCNDTIKNAKLKIENFDNLTEENV